MLSVYNLTKPPKYGNCTETEKTIETMISVADIKEIYKKTKTETSKALEKLRNKLENLINYTNHEVDEVLDHDYWKAPVIECVIYDTDFYYPFIL